MVGCVRAEKVSKGGLGRLRLQEFYVGDAVRVGVSRHGSGRSRYFALQSLVL